VTVQERLGIHERFWEAHETSEAVSRHTVNIVYRTSPTNPNFTIDLDEQHSDYRFVSEVKPEMHDYVEPES